MRLVNDDAWAVMTIWAEARGEAHFGKVAVAEVIRNRMKGKYQSDGSVPGTVLRPLQFSCWNSLDANRLAAAMISDTDLNVGDCILAWKESEHSDLTRGAVLYYNPAVVSHPPVWAIDANRTAVVGAHHFYKDGRP